MNKRLQLLLRQAAFNLRGGFLVRPLTIALTLGCGGAILSWLEETFPALSDMVPKALFPSHSDPQVAQFILGGIAASIMTVVFIVFAILLMTLTLASMQFSPRIIVSFTKDRVTQWTLGIFLGTFSYCMAALPTARLLPRPFAPVATVMGEGPWEHPSRGERRHAVGEGAQEYTERPLSDAVPGETEDDARRELHGGQG